MAVFTLTAAGYSYMNEPVHTTSDHSPGMAKASMMLGIFSLVTIATGFSYIVGSVGVILALLSRGSSSFSSQAKTGLVSSAIGIIGGFAVTVFAFFALFSGSWSETMDRLDSLYETYLNQGTLNPSDLERSMPNGNEGGSTTEKTALIVVLPDGEEVAV